MKNVEGHPTEYHAELRVHELWPQTSTKTKYRVEQTKPSTKEAVLYESISIEFKNRESWFML